MRCESCRREIALGATCLCGQLVGRGFEARCYFPWKIDGRLVHRSARLDDFIGDIDFEAARRRGSPEALRLLLRCGDRLSLRALEGSTVRAACVGVARHFLRMSDGEVADVGQLIDVLPFNGLLGVHAVRWAVHLLERRGLVAALPKSTAGWLACARVDRRDDLRRFAGERR